MDDAGEVALFPVVLRGLELLKPLLCRIGARALAERTAGLSEETPD